MCVYKYYYYWISYIFLLIYSIYIYLIVQPYIYNNNPNIDLCSPFATHPMQWHVLRPFPLQAVIILIKCIKAKLGKTKVQTSRSWERGKGSIKWGRKRWEGQKVNPNELQTNYAAEMSSSGDKLQGNKATMRNDDKRSATVQWLRKRHNESITEKER